MAAELPARVQPVDGAEVVVFPWEAAANAVAAFNAAESTLGSQLGGRPAMIDTIVDWIGTYRDEFDAAYSRITSTGTGLRDTLIIQASSIVGWAENANQAQRDNNTRAQASAPATSGARPI